MTSEREIGPGDMSPDYLMTCLARWVVHHHAQGDPESVKVWLDKWGERHGAESRERLRGYCRGVWRERRAA
jgi:hypothetical protein